MKRLLMALLLMGTPIYADGLTDQGLADPPVMKPADTWSGFYMGLNASRASSTTTTESCRKVFEGTDYGPYPCDDKIFDYYPEAKVIDTTSFSTSDTTGGIFAGYRHDFGRLVGGVEANIGDDYTTLEAQAGIDMNRVLLYGLAGANDDGDSIYGAGIDMITGRGMLLGVKHTNEATSLRIGWRF